jgi:protein-disulfide isomerase
MSSLTALALLLSCSASGAREGSTPPAKSDTAQAAQAGAATPPTVYRDGINGVDLSGLDSAAKERAIKLLNDQVCDCGCKYGSVAACRVKDPGCPRSQPMANTIVAAVKSGKSDSDVIAALKTGAAPAAAPAPAAPTGPVQISLDGAQMKGNPKAAATLVEYADYQCPYCARAVPVVQQLVAKYGDGMRYVFKQYPLTSIHPFAEPAARASLAAANQGKFWEMHDVLFRNNRALDDASLRKYAQDLGLDMAKFDKDRGDASVNEALARDVAEAQRVGVQGTPSFFINGVQAPSWDVETMSRMIDTAKSGGDVSAVASEVRKQYEEAARKQQEAMQQAATRVHEIDIAGSPMKGDPKAPVTIVEFSDFQCPYCASSEPLIKQVLDAYAGKVRLVYKQMPLNIHPNARPASIAALEALEHGKFWEMHDLLFQNYSQLSRDNILNFAKQVGVDPADVQKALDTQEHNQTIEKDIADYVKTGLPMSTPSFFVNGRKVMQRDFDTFKRMIEEALKPATAQAAG